MCNKLSKLSYPELLQKAREGDHASLDVLISKHESFLLSRIYKRTSKIKDLLELQEACKSTVYSRFKTTFNPREHASFAMWFVGHIETICKEKNRTEKVFVNQKKL